MHKNQTMLASSDSVYIKLWKMIYGNLKGQTITVLQGLEFRQHKFEAKDKAIRPRTEEEKHGQA